MRIKGLKSNKVKNTEWVNNHQVNGTGEKGQKQRRHFFKLQANYQEKAIASGT